MPSTLTFSTESLPSFTVGQAQTFTIEAIGGTRPYSFGITQGDLPPGLSLNSQGVLSGTPTEAGGDWTIWVKLIDFVNDHVTQAFKVEVDDA